MAADNKMISLTIPAEIYADVQYVAKLGGRSAQHYMRTAIMSTLSLDQLRLKRIEAQLLTRQESRSET